MTIWVVLAVAFNVIVIDGLLGLDRLFQAAVMTMAVLPPPFVIPLYLHARSRGGGAAVDGPHGLEHDGEAAAGGSRISEADHDYVLSTLSLGTVATLAAFLVVGVVYAS
jgi:hypothetical protein